MKVIKLVQSLKKWICDNHEELLPLIEQGNLELLTKEMQDEYFEWLKTEDGKKYIKDGSEYKEEK